MPGHVGTSLPINTPKVLGKLDAVSQGALNFRDQAPMTATQAATIILEGVCGDAWRILVGDDAHELDRLVRESPETAYEPSLVQALHEMGICRGSSNHRNHSAERRPQRGHARANRPLCHLSIYKSR